MNKGYPWRGVVLINRFDYVVKRKIPARSSRMGYECQFCGSVFTRKHVRWVGDGWSCRDSCERKRKGLP